MVDKILKLSKSIDTPDQILLNYTRRLRYFNKVYFLMHCCIKNAVEKKSKVFQKKTGIKSIVVETADRQARNVCRGPRVLYSMLRGYRSAMGGFKLMYFVIVHHCLMYPYAILFHE